MATKKKRKKQPNLGSRIVSLIERGPMGLRDMTGILAAPYQSLNTEALELQRLGVLQKDAEGLWSLVPGVNPGKCGIEIITSDSTFLTASQPDSSRTYQDDFKDLLRSVGVKLAVDSITDIYFAGENIWDARWLHKVLSGYSEGFVNEGQCKLIMGCWTRKHGVSYEHEDFFED